MVPAGRVRRRFILGLVAALAVATISVLLRPAARAFNFDGSVPGDHAVPAIHPDPRVRWNEYSVGGLGLTSPDTTITIPPGSILVVPTPVEPDGTATDETT